MTIIHSYTKWSGDGCNMDLREAKVLEITAKFRLIFDKGVWLVPSQNSNAVYRASLAPSTSAARAFHQDSAAPLDFTLISRIINLFFTAQRCTERHPMDRLTRTFFANNVCLIALAIAGFASLSNLLLPAESVDSTSRGVVAWWTALCAVSVVNLGLWRLSAEALARRKGSVEPAVYRFQRWQLLLSAVYVLGCGFRSIVPRADVQRLGLFDSWVSSV